MKSTIPIPVWTRAKFKAQEFLRDRCGIELRPPLRALGYEWHFVTHKTFIYLLSEVFDSDEYYFNTDSRQPLVLDCGANIGAATLYFKRLYPESRVICFEPFKLAYEALQKNVAVNSLTHVTTHNVALAASHGEANLFFNPKHLGSLSMSLVPGRIRGETAQVRTVPLSEFIDQPIDLLKMDIEGAEMIVLQEIAQSGKLKFVRQILLEYHHHIPDRPDEFSTVLRLLEENGFGYRLSAGVQSRRDIGAFQDILVHAYSRQLFEKGGSFYTSQRSLLAEKTTG